MEVVEVSKQEFESLAEKPFHVFQKVSFNELNREKCDDIHYLLFKENRYKLAIIIGGIGGKAFSPFSAPYGGFYPITDDVKLSCVEEAVKKLTDWLIEKKYSYFEINLPPDMYHSTFISKQISSLWRFGYRMKEINLNYALDLDTFTDNYHQQLPRNARKNLNRALKSEMDFKLCQTLQEKALAYEIIKKNRSERGFPLRMSWQQVYDTVQCIDADFFLVYNNLKEPIASAVVFHVSRNIVQVIYWGDLHEYAHFKTMNYLSFKLFEYYKRCEVSIVDIGPSTEDSIPNHGLAEFKESIGCFVSPKYKMELKLI